MRRTGVRSALLVGWVGFVGLTALFGLIGRPSPITDVCRQLPVVALTFDLADAGQIDEARTALTDARRPDSDEAEQIDDECFDDVVERLNQRTFSDRVVDGVGDTWATLPWLEDLEDASTALSDGTASTIRFLLWFAPSALVLLSIREFVITRLDRRPGPVDVTVVRIDGKVSTSNEAMLRRSLRQIDLDPSPTTPGGIGEIVLPVVEVSSNEGGAITTIANLARQLVLPESGFELECEIDTSGGSYSGSVTVRTKRGKQVLAVAPFATSSIGEAISRAASEAFFAIHRFPSIERRTAAWSLWSSSANLARYIELAPIPTSDALKSFLRDEPGNLAVRIAYARALGREAEDAQIAYLRAIAATRDFREELEQRTAMDRIIEPFDDWTDPEEVLSRPDVARLGDEDREKLAQLLDDEQKKCEASDDAAFRGLHAAVGAVRRSHRLIEPRALLAIALAFSPSLHLSTSRSKDAQRARSALVALRRTHPVSVGAWSGHYNFQDPSDHLAVTVGVCRRAIWGLRLPATWWRWLMHRRLRRSIPIRSLLPFESGRRAAIHNTSSILLYARLSTPRSRSRLAVQANRRARVAGRLRLRWLRIRHRLVPDSHRLSFTQYNLLLCETYLVGGGQSTWPVSEPLRGIEARLQGVFFGLSQVVSKASVESLWRDADLFWHHKTVEKWLSDADLRRNRPETDWIPVAKARVMTWRKSLASLLAGGYGRADQFERLTTMESELAADVAAIRTDPTNQPAGLPGEPKQELERIRTAIVEQERMVPLAQLETLARERLRIWTAFSDRLQDEKKAPAEAKKEDVEPSGEIVETTGDETNEAPVEVDETSETGEPNPSRWALARLWRRLLNTIDELFR